MTLEGIKVLVTGGAGFIGSHLVDGLIAAGASVVVLDNFATGSRNNIEQHLGNPRFTLIEGDIRHPDVCRDTVQGCKMVLHHAALGSVPRSIEHPLETNATNVTGFMNMLEASRKEGVSRFIYASSSSVYGDDQHLPKIEEQIGEQLSPYAVSKRTNELYGRVFSRLYKMEVIGLRYFNVFGPRQNPNGPYAAVIPIFTTKLLNGEDCTIHGDGNNRRDFTFVSNVVNANLNAIKANSKFADGRIFNIAFGATETVNNLYKMICASLNINRDPVFAPPRAGEIRDSFADISAARQQLGYQPRIDLREGVGIAVNWYKDLT